LARRCGSCGARLRSRPLETSDADPLFEVRVAGRPQTARRVRIIWDEAERRRLSTWLLTASVVTIALVLVLLVLARVL
jgi:uncharacterized protein (DUF983 family)